jgi:hypothetical protein
MPSGSPLTQTLGGTKGRYVVRQQNQRLSARTEQPRGGEAARGLRRRHYFGKDWQPKLDRNPFSRPPLLAFTSRPCGTHRLLWASRGALHRSPQGSSPVNWYASLRPQHSSFARTAQRWFQTKALSGHLRALAAAMRWPHKARWWPQNPHRHSAWLVPPNPSVKRSANGMAHWPSSAGASPHFALAAQRAMPLAPAYLKR